MRRCSGVASFTPSAANTIAYQQEWLKTSTWAIAMVGFGCNAKLPSLAGGQVTAERIDLHSQRPAGMALHLLLHLRAAIQRILAQRRQCSVRSTQQHARTYECSAISPPRSPRTAARSCSSRAARSSAAASRSGATAAFRRSARLLFAILQVSSSARSRVT